MGRSTGGVVLALAGLVLLIGGVRGTGQRAWSELMAPAPGSPAPKSGPGSGQTPQPGPAPSPAPSGVTSLPPGAPGSGVTVE